MSTQHSQSISLLIDLIQRDSVTPNDNGCQDLIAKRLGKLGFNLEHLPSGDVSNLWARLGSEAPLLVFAGHTDVVPTGDVNAWASPPFSAEIVDGHIVGRGAADMKGGVAAMITAIERFVESGANKHGSIAVLITSDEEGPAIEGTAHVVDILQQRGESIDYCVLGEPSSTATLGDIIRHGRRGSLSASLTVKGKQGHVAYPHLADNPVHRALPALSELTSIEWDQGDDHFPPTTLQISNVHAGTGASNVIPAELQLDFNLRYGPATTVEHIKTTVTQLCQKHELDVNIEWTDSAHPFITEPGILSDTVKRAIQDETGISATMDTGGGTSDGRFIAPTGAQLIEFGPINATIHQIDERVCCADIDATSRIYESVLHQLLGNKED